MYDQHGPDVVMVRSYGDVTEVLTACGSWLRLSGDTTPAHAMIGQKDELAERRDQKLDEGLVWLTPKGQALWAELKEDRQRPGENNDVYRARKRLNAGALDLRFRQEMVARGYVEPDPSLPIPGTGCPVHAGPE